MDRNKSKLFFFLLTIGLFAVLYLSRDMLSTISDGNLGGGVIRQASFIGYEESTIGAIMNLPFPINILFSTLFFLYLPLLSFPSLDLNQIAFNGIFIGFLTPLFLFPLWKYIYNASITALFGNSSSARRVLYIAILFALVLGTISLQFRHKTVLFPIICILAAIGKRNYDVRFHFLSVLLAGITIGVELIVAIL